MASQAPNPREFKAWEDAFQYPVPIVRRLEQQLRGQINENQDKLRTLVGTSYRDLLGTAERIIDMDNEMHEAEDILGGIGQKCNARAIERIASNHARTAKSQRDRGTRRNAQASTIALLQICMTQAGRIVKQRGSPLTAAKLLVLARLLHSSASKAQDPPPLLDTLRSRLVSLRRRLLEYVDRVLAGAEIDKADLVELLAAFSLATTSTPTDVLRHFLQVRATALRELSEISGKDNVHTAMDLLISTLKDVQSVFPGRLADLLARLQSDPLLKDAEVCRIHDLNLDIYERWIADDVRNFTPWLRHDQLQFTQAAKILKEWAGNAKSMVVAGLKQHLSVVGDAQNITILRKDILSRCLSTDRKLTVLDISSFFQDLRSCFVERLQEVTRDAGHGLMTVVTQSLDDKTLVPNGPPTPTLDLWNPANTDIDLSKGATEFRSLITNCYHGKDVRLMALDGSLNQWSTKIAALSGTIKVMRDDRWNDDLDLDIDEDLDLEDPQSLLSRDDPTILAELLNVEKDKAMSKVYEQIQQRADQNADKIPNSVFLIRLLREVVQHASSTERSTTPLSRPPSSLLDTLNVGLVQQVIDKASSYRKTLATTKGPDFSRAPATMLWEGTPALPVQPSATCFRYLSETCRAMKDTGSDLWTLSAIDALKARLRDIVAESVSDLEKSNGESSDAGPSEELNNGDVHSEKADNTETQADATGESDQERPDARQNVKVVQTLYDVLYMDKVLGITADRENVEDRLTVALKQLGNHTELEHAATERLRKSAMDYYKRTYLLFGILAAS